MLAKVTGPVSSNGIYARPFCPQLAWHCRSDIRRLLLQRIRLGINYQMGARERTPHYLRPVLCNSTRHMANLFLRQLSTMLSQAAPNPVDSINYKRFNVLHGQHAQQLCLWLQHIRPSTYHTTKWRKCHDHARWLRLGQTLH